MLLEALLNYPGVAKERARTLTGVQGDVLEVGFGSGLNLPHYPGEVRRIVAVEPSRSIARLADKRIARASFPVEVVGLKGEDIDADSGSFDSVVSTFTLCSIPAVEVALSNLHRVLKPDGRFYFLEHGLAPIESVARMQRRLNGVWGKFAGGCNLDRPIDRLVTSAGFTMESMDTYFMPWSPKFVSFFYRGVARR